MKKQYPDVRLGQTWRDRDKRMASGNRRVRVMRIVGEGPPATVYYQQVVGNGNLLGSGFRSRYARFQRAFELIAPAQADPSVRQSSAPNTDRPRATSSSDPALGASR